MNTTAQQQDKPSLPGSIEAEFALLGSIMAHPKAFALCADLVPDDFLEPLHSRIFQSLTDQINSSGKAIPIALTSHFRGDETLKSMGMEASAYIAKLVSNAEMLGSVPYLVKMIKNDSGLRRLHECSTLLASECLAPEYGETVVDVAGRAIQTFTSIATDNGQEVRKVKFSVKDVANDILTAVNQTLQDGVLPEGGAYCGTRELHRIFNGWKAGRYYVIGGRPGMGKTTVAESLLIRTAGKGNPVLFFSLEMGAEELTARLIADVSYEARDRIEYQAIERHEITPSQFERILEVQDKLNTAPFTIYDKSGLTLAQVRAVTLKEKQRLEGIGQQLKVICIDHIGLMRASERYSGNKVAETEEISIGLKALAKDLGIAVVALVQLNRGPDSREDKRPSLTDLRWSGSIEQDADAVIFCYRPEYYLERQKCDDAMKELDRVEALALAKNKLELIVAKHRGGACPNIEMFCDIGCSAVRDIIR